MLHQLVSAELSYEFLALGPPLYTQQKVRAAMHPIARIMKTTFKSVTQLFWLPWLPTVKLSIRHRQISKKASYRNLTRKLFQKTSDLWSLELQKQQTIAVL